MHFIFTTTYYREIKTVRFIEVNEEYAIIISTPCLFHFTVLHKTRFSPQNYSTCVNNKYTEMDNIKLLLLECKFPFKV